MAVIYEASSGGKAATGGDNVRLDAPDYELLDDTISLTAADLLVVFIEAYHNNSDTWTFTDVQLGNGTTWESLTEMTSARYREDFGTDSDFGTIFYIENPTLSYTQLRAQHTGGGDISDTNNYSYVALAVTGANIGGSEAALFPNEQSGYRSASGSGTYTETLTGGAAGDMGAAAVLGYDLASNSADVTVSTGATERENGFSGVSNCIWTLGTNDYANDSDIDVTINQWYAYSLLHIAAAAAEGNDQIAGAASLDFDPSGALRGRGQLAGLGNIDFAPVGTIQDASGPVITSVNDNLTWTDGDSGLIILGSGFLD